MGKAAQHATRLKALKVGVAGLLLVYPFAVYFADGRLTPNQLLAGLLLLFAARLLLAARLGSRPRANLALAVLLIAAAVAVVLWLPDVDIHLLRFYPLLLNLLAFAVFFGSLFSRMPLIERVAHLLEPELPPEGVRYTRQVTWAWSGLLLLVALGSLYTAIESSLRVWSLYNGLIVYVIFGAAFSCEYLVRTRLRRRWAAAG